MAGSWRRNVFALACWIGLVPIGIGQDAPDPHAPLQFEHHPDIDVSIFAIEPQVVDPVALCFAANGDCYVVEMRDYPYGFGPARAPGGTVRRLRDTDGDGRADESTFFADQLSYPTSIMPWRDGVLVLAPPQLLFLRDENDDGRADQREVVLEGFDLGVTDSNANSLRWGIDNWIHGANGGNGGQLRFSGVQGEVVRLGTADFALRPDQRQLRRTYQTGGGFGLVCDGRGHTFTTYNIDYLQQRTIPIEQVERAIDIEPFAATENISDHGLSARIYPIVAAETRVNHPEQAGHFSSAGGMGFLTGPPFSERLQQSVFVCDVVCNLVHRDRLREEGPVFRAARAPEEQDREFLASRDPAFRPVGLESGPDGALYLIDMQRDVIEHPDYIPERVLATLNIRGGDDRGRIYRITPRGQKLDRGERLHQLSSSKLVPLLASEIRWKQETAHRLLIQRHATEQADALRELARSARSTDTRLRALWILAGLEQLQSDDLAMALDDRSADLRETAVNILSQKLERTTAETDRLAQCLHDSASRVRFAAALALDGVDAAQELTGLQQMLERELDQKWTRRAVLLAADERSAELLAWAWENPDIRRIGWEAARRDCLRELAFASASMRSTTNTQLDDWLSSNSWRNASRDDLVSLLQGFHAAWTLRPAAKPAAAAIGRWMEHWASDALTGIESELMELSTLMAIVPPAPLAAAIQQAYQQLNAASQSADLSARVRAAQLVARTGSEEAQQALLAIIERNEPLELQHAAIAGLKRLKRTDTGHRLTSIWSQLSPRLRLAVIDLLLSNTNYHEAIVAALESQTIRFSELNLDLEQRRTLLRSSSPQIAERAARLFGDEEYSNRKAIVTEWLAKLPAAGDLEEGRVVFANKCATCHHVKGTGFRVGPELEALSHRSVEDLLSHILDPNMAINPNYVSCVIETEDGEVINGLLHTESPEAITLLQPEAKSVTIPRQQIAQMRTLETSLMPEGLEKDLSPQQVRSLIRFLQER